MDKVKLTKRVVDAAKSKTKDYRLWDAETGRLLRRLRDPDRWSATLSPDGRTLAVQTGGALELHDAATGRIMSQHHFPGSSIVWSTRAV